MAILPIAPYNDEVLTTEAEPVGENSEELQQLIDDMFETMYNAEGVGLAAPQVGRLLRLFVADVDVITKEREGEKDEETVRYGPIVMINPEIVASSDDQVELEEGCLSIPGVNGNVTRPRQIRIRYLDRDFEEQEMEADGWLSRVLQHERDHLDGILFLEYLTLFKRKLLSSKLKQISEGRLDIDYPVVSKNRNRATG